MAEFSDIDNNSKGSHQSLSRESLSAFNLQKTYGRRRVVKDVSLSVNRGDVVGLLGANGAGKTTTFYMMTGLERTENGKTIQQPASASSDKIAYTDNNKQIRYEGNVDIRQGTDRITAGVADIYLDEKNELKQTIAQNDVVITQPNRRIRGSYAQYTTTDEIVILRGNPAVVEDAVQGTSQGSQFTVSMRENRVVNQGATPTKPGRTRTVYKVKNQ